MSRAATVVQSKARVYTFKTDAEGLWHNNEQTLAVGTCLIGKQGVGDGRRGEGGVGGLGGGGYQVSVQSSWRPDSSVVTDWPGALCGPMTGSVSASDRKYVR